MRVLDEALSDRDLGLRRGRQRVRLSVPPLLNVGSFTVGLWVGTAHEELLDEPAAAAFSLQGHDRGRPDRVLVGGPAVRRRRGPDPVRRSWARDR